MNLPCMFCDHKGYLPELLNMALYSRYQSDFCQLQLRGASIIKFQDEVCYEENEDYYTFPYLKAKQKQLIEYYRYHRDIPRFFIQNITTQLENYHEKQREIRYKKIKQQLGMNVQETTRDHIHLSFKALKGLSELQTSRQLQQLLKLIPQQPLIVDKSAIAILIMKQKQQMQEIQKMKKKTHPKLYTLQQDCTHHKKQLTLFTEQSLNPEERNEFYKRWSDVLSHRQLQYHKNKIKSTLLNKKKSLK